MVRGQSVGTTGLNDVTPKRTNDAPRPNEPWFLVVRSTFQSINTCDILTKSSTESLSSPFVLSGDYPTLSLASCPLRIALANKGKATKTVKY